jgi:hypothetical protein
MFEPAGGAEEVEDPAWGWVKDSASSSSSSACLDGSAVLTRLARARYPELT